MPYNGQCQKCGEPLPPPLEHVEKRIRIHEAKKWIKALQGRIGGKALGEVIETVKRTP